MKEQDEVIRSQNKLLSKQDAINNKQQQEIDELKAMVKALARVRLIRLRDGTFT